MMCYPKICTIHFPSKVSNLQVIFEKAFFTTEEILYGIHKFKTGNILRGHFSTSVCCHIFPVQKCVCSSERNSVAVSTCGLQFIEIEDKQLIDILTVNSHFYLFVAA